MNKNELADFVQTVKAASTTSQRVVAVVDQQLLINPNLCLFPITTTNRHGIISLDIIYILIKFFLSPQYNPFHVNMASNSVQEGRPLYQSSAINFQFTSKPMHSHTRTVDI